MTQAPTPPSPHRTPKLMPRARNRIRRHLPQTAQRAGRNQRNQLLNIPQFPLASAACILPDPLYRHVLSAVRLREVAVFGRERGVATSGALRAKH